MLANGATSLGTADEGPDGRGGGSSRERARQKLADIVEFGTEADFVAAVKAYRPETGKEELIMQFRAGVRERRGLC